MLEISSLKCKCSSVRTVSTFVSSSLKHTQISILPFKSSHNYVTTAHKTAKIKNFRQDAHNHQVCINCVDSRIMIGQNTFIALRVYTAFLTNNRAGAAFYCCTTDYEIDLLAGTVSLGVFSCH